MEGEVFKQVDHPGSPHVFEFGSFEGLFPLTLIEVG